jgi:regulatory protein
VRLLSRREHSRTELESKLRRRGFPPEAIGTLLDELAAEGLQSDSRFAETYVRRRMEAGFGPRRIALELRERGVAGLVEGPLADPDSALWDEALARVRRKRFGPGLPADLAESARQARFLEYRGFAADRIRRLLKADPD